MQLFSQVFVVCHDLSGMRNARISCISWTSRSLVAKRGRTNGLILLIHLHFSLLWYSTIFDHPFPVGVPLDGWPRRKLRLSLLRWIHSSSVTHCLHSCDVSLSNIPLLVCLNLSYFNFYEVTPFASVTKRPRGVIYRGWVKWCWKVIYFWSSPCPHRLVLVILETNSVCFQKRVFVITQHWKHNTLLHHLHLKTSNLTGEETRNILRPDDSETCADKYSFIVCVNLCNICSFKYNFLSVEQHASLKNHLFLTEIYEYMGIRRYAQQPIVCSPFIYPSFWSVGSVCTTVACTLATWPSIFRIYQHLTHFFLFT